MPSACVHCGGVLTARQRGLCASCWAAIEPLCGPRCPRCGRPADSCQRACWRCEDEPPPQVGVWAVGAYVGSLRSAVLAVKHHRRDDLVAPLVERLMARLPFGPGEVDAVVPVPSRPWQRLRRGGVAAELVGRELARRLRVPCVRSLVRRGHADRQTGRSRVARQRLPKETFAVRRRVAGRVLLVDDVHTTGTTVRHCAHALLNGGASEVRCAVVAWTPELGRSV